MKVEALRCLVIGSDGVGKTSLLMTKGLGRFPEEHVPTVFQPIEVSNDDRFSFKLITVFDSANQETYDQPRLLSYLSTDLAIICYSVTSPQSLQDIPGKWIPELRRFSPTTPFVMVGLKTDARNENEHHRISQISSSSSGSTDSTGSFESQNEDEIMPWMLDYDEEIEIVDRKTAKKIARANGALAHVECSAKTGQSVDLLFQEILPRVLEHHRPRNRKRRSLVRRLGRFLHVRTTDATEAGTKL